MEVDTIVAGYDGSDNARLALDAAIDLLSDDGTIHVVTAFDGPSNAEMGRLMASLPDEFRSGFDILAGPRGVLRDAENILDEHGVRHEAHFVEEKPAGAVLDIADKVDADMIVVGSRGLGRGTRFIRGSVSTKIASHARTSFLVIHEDHEDDE